MKYTTILAFYVTIGLVNTFSYAKQDPIKFPISKNDSNSIDEINKINEKILYIEKALNELQNHIFDQHNNTTTIYSCYITTPFDGTFISSGKTEAEAKGLTLKKCQKKTGCLETKLTCSKNTTSISNQTISNPVNIKSLAINDLENKIFLLEKAVVEIQEKVFSKKNQTTQKKIKLYSCYLKTPFHGAVTANGKTEAEAKGLTLQKCKNNPGCKEKHLKCSHTN